MKFNDILKKQTKRKLKSPFKVVQLESYFEIYLDEYLSNKALISAEDEDLLNYRWYNSPKSHSVNYARRTINTGETYVHVALHRVIAERVLGEAPSDHVVDHINGNPLDNRRENLRYASSSINCTKRKYMGNNSGYKNVRKVIRGGRESFYAYFEQNRKNVIIGCFPNPEEAYEAVLEKKKEIYNNSLISVPVKSIK